MMKGLMGLLGGGGWIYAAVFGVGATVGGWGGAMWANAQFRELAERVVDGRGRMAGAIITLVQNGGRREMNMLWNQQAERAACASTIETFQDWDVMSAAEKQAARTRAERLQDELATRSTQYDQLKASYEKADATVTDWLNTRLPDDLCIVRYGADACRADPIAAAGFPAAERHPEPLAEPSGRERPAD